MTEQVKKRQVAIIKGAREYRGEYDDCDHWVARSITQWYEVTEEEYKALQHFCSLYDYRIVEPLPPQETADVLKQAVEVWTAYQKDQERRQRELEKARKVSAEKKAKKLADKRAKEIEEVARRAMELGLLPQAVAQK